VRDTGGGGHPDNELPGHEGPVDPGYGIDLGHGIDNSLPEPPVGTWPPPSFGRPIVPIIDNTLPVQPGTIWPSPGKPARPDHTLPGQPALPDNSLPSGKFWIVAGIPGLGWRYVCVDPSLKPGHALPPTPVPEPKR
jgi:hypothetical protein